MNLLTKRMRAIIEQFVETQRRERVSMENLHSMNQYSARSILPAAWSGDPWPEEWEPPPVRKEDRCRIMVGSHRCSKKAGHVGLYHASARIRDRLIVEGIRPVWDGE